MASSNPPPESHDALQQYLDQKLKDISQGFQPQVDTLNDQLQHLITALGAHTMPSLAVGRPVAPAYAPSMPTLDPCL